MIWVEILSFLALGSVIGLLSGLLGIGGGTIAIPVMIFLFPVFGKEPADAMQIAIGTSLAAVIVTTFSAAKSHHLFGRVRWTIVKKVTLSFILGSVTGSILVHLTSSEILQQVFAVFEIILGSYFFFMKMPHTPIAHPVPRSVIMNIGGYLISALSVFLGVGGGFLTVPALVHCKIPIKEAIGTSAALSFLIATMGSILFLLPALQTPSNPYTLGYIYLPAFLAMSIASFPFARLGVKLINKVPSGALKKAFSLLIIGAGIAMLL